MLVAYVILLMQEASNERKMQMQEFDRTRQKNEELNELELEAQQQSEYLLQKAKEQQDEQEDEVKKINEVIIVRAAIVIRWQRKLSYINDMKYS